MDHAPASPFALVVDDNALIRMDACAILSDAGFQSHQAVSGDEARELLERLAPDIILLFTDVQMPGRTDGFALARLVAERWDHIEIVVASGNSKPTAEDLPAKAVFIDKPFTEQVVFDHLKKALPEEKQPEPLREGT